MIRGILIILMGIMFSTAAFAQSATEADIEARAKNVGHSLRCVVCQNQSIEESDASLAEDMQKWRYGRAGHRLYAGALR